jgi:hypothetical protein
VKQSALSKTISEIFEALDGTGNARRKNSSKMAKHRSWKTECRDKIRFIISFPNKDLTTRRRERL